MPAPASLDIKKRIISLHHSHFMPVKDICHVLGIQKSLAYTVLAHYCCGLDYTTTSTCQLSQRRKLNALDLSFIRGQLKCLRSLYLDKIQDELAKHCGKHISISATWRTLQQMDYSQKRVSAIAREWKELC